MNGFTLGFDNASGGVLHLPERVRVTLLALGDVGSTLLTGTCFCSAPPGWCRTPPSPAATCAWRSMG